MTGIRNSSDQSRATLARLPVTFKLLGIIAIAILNLVSCTVGLQKDFRFEVDELPEVVEFPPYGLRATDRQGQWHGHFITSGGALHGQVEIRYALTGVSKTYLVWPTANVHLDERRALVGRLDGDLAAMTNKTFQWKLNARGFTLIERRGDPLPYQFVSLFVGGDALGRPVGGIVATLITLPEDSLLLEETPARLYVVRYGWAKPIVGLSQMEVSDLRGPARFVAEALRSRDAVAGAKTVRIKRAELRFVSPERPALSGKLWVIDEKGNETAVSVD